MQQAAIHGLLEENGELEILGYHKSRILLVVLPGVIGRSVIDGTPGELPAPLVDGNHNAAIDKLDRDTPALVIEDVCAVYTKKKTQNSPLNPGDRKVKSIALVKIPGHDPLKEVIRDNHLV